MTTLNVFLTLDSNFIGYIVESLDLISVLAIITAVYVIMTKNPIISILFLIGLFITIAMYLLLIGLTFLGISYLLVYVGAVSILFLFILMLLNVRISELVSETRNSIALIFITVICLNIPIYEAVSNSTDLSGRYSENILSGATGSWANNLIESGHIYSIGNIIYSSHSLLLILVSIILIQGMVGTIVITLKYNNSSTKNFEIIEGK